MPKDNPNPNEFIAELFADISEGFPKAIANYIQYDLLYDLDWPKIPDYLNIHFKYLTPFIQGSFPQWTIVTAFKEGWITVDECKQYIELLDWAELQLMRQLFKASSNPNLFWLSTENVEQLGEKVKERLIAIHAILKILDDKISKKLATLELIRKNEFPKKFDYTLLKEQSLYYEKVITQGNFYKFCSKKVENDNGWKIHLSVAHDDLEKAYELAMPVLVKKRWDFKIVDTSSINVETNSLLNFHGSKQFTIYLEETEGVPTIPSNEIEEVLSEIQALFKTHGICAGEKPNSDRALKYDYFSIRNDHASIWGILFRTAYVSAKEAGRNYNPEAKENPYAILLAEPLELFSPEQHLNEFIDAESQPQRAKSMPVGPIFYVTFFAMLNAYLTKENYAKIVLINQKTDALEEMSKFLTDLKFKDEYETPERHRFVKDCLTLFNGGLQEILDDEKADNFLRKITLDVMREAFYKHTAYKDTTVTTIEAKSILDFLEYSNGIFQEDINDTDSFTNSTDSYERYVNLKGMLSTYPDLLKRFSDLVLRFAEEGNEVSIAFMLDEKNKDIFGSTEEAEQVTSIGFRR